MTFQKLQERLRRRVLAHIEAGQITGLRLAEMAGFQQAHMSNFLNRKRALSLDAMDRVLAALRWSVTDLFDDAELGPLAARMPAREDDYENAPLVDGAAALQHAVIPVQQIREVLKFKRTFLKRLRPEAAPGRSQWQRFVLVKADGREGMSMYPRLLPGATLLVDRHYTSLRPYRRNERNMYAVRYGGSWTAKYVEQSSRTLVLRPHNESYPLSVIHMTDSESPADYILGRICHVGIET